MADIIKINDTTVVKVGTQEDRRIYKKTQLTERKASLEAELVEINALIDALK